MDSNLHVLPPLKRFSSLHRESSLPQPSLPAKKRKESRDLLPSATPIAAVTGTTCCLPMKKRIWAMPPDFSPLDLNVEYKPSLEEEQEKEAWETVQAQGLPVAEDDDEMLEKGLNEGGYEDEVEEDDGILCAICGSTDGDPLDPIVLCDGCDLMVHSTCYGNPLVKGVPQGDWFCAQCLESQYPRKDEADNVCCLCPMTGGALKPTTNGRWAHVVCALFVPEVFFEDPEGREGINCSQVPKPRWKEACYVCGGRNGCAIECSEVNCPLWFHVTCGLKEGLCIEYRQGKRKGAIVAGFCKEHTALWEHQKRTGKFKIVARGP